MFTRGGEHKALNLETLEYVEPDDDREEASDDDDRRRRFGRPGRGRRVRSKRPALT